MFALRRLALRHRTLAALICAAALALKLLVPAGYMVSTTPDGIVVTICSGTTSQTMVLAIPGVRGDTPDHRMPGDHGKHEMPCAFAGLSAQMLGGVDPVLLVLAIAFVMVMGLRPARSIPRSCPLYLRPPSRAPPAFL